MKDKFMIEALKEANKAYKNDDVPVGAIIVENGKIISRGYNRKEKDQVATKHAEIIAIEKACRSKKSWYLDNCELYVTMEPCIMCCGVLIQARIKKVVYATKNEKFGGIESIDRIFDNKNSNHIVNYESGILSEESTALIKDFFKGKRA